MGGKLGSTSPWSATASRTLFLLETAIQWLKGLIKRCYINSFSTLRKFTQVYNSFHVSEAAAYSMEVFQHCPTRRKYFKHFTDDNIYKAVVQVCHLLGLYGKFSINSSPEMS